MSALPAPFPLRISSGIAEQRDPAGAHQALQCWVSLAEASTLMGRSQRALRRDCLRLESKGLARRFGTGARPCWRVHRACHPSLTRAAGISDSSADALESPRAALLADLRTTTDSRRDLAERRARFTLAFRAWRTGSKIADYVRFSGPMARECGLSRIPSRATAYAWHARAPASDDFEGVMASMLDGRRGPATGSSIPDEAWTLFQSYYLSPQQWSVAKCVRAITPLSSRRGWSIPSISRMHELVRERIAPGVAEYHRLGQDAWRRRHQAPLEQDPEAYAAGECWESDHSCLDLFVRAFVRGKWIMTRPWVSAWLDRRSRLLAGWHVSLEHNSLTIRLALLRALRANGHPAPRVAWMDNGKDFAGSEINGSTRRERRAATRDADRDHQTGLLAQLGIEAHWAMPMNHNGKARIESFFRVRNLDFDREFPSWCGSKPGDVDPDRMAAIQGDTMSLPTVDEVASKFDAWAAQYNTRTDHAIDDLVDPVSRTRLSPLRFFEAGLTERRVIDDDALWLLERPWTRAIKPSKRGVGLRIDGRTIYYGPSMPELEALVGSSRRVRVSYDPADMNSVRVSDELGRFICIAPMSAMHGGVTDEPLRRDALRDGLARQRDQRRRAAMKQDMPAMLLGEAELARAAQRTADIARERARIGRDATRGDAPPIRIVRTGLEGEAERVRAAVRRRVAVGAESLPSQRDLLSEGFMSSDDASPGQRPRDLLRLSPCDEDTDIPAARSGLDILLATGDETGPRAQRSVMEMLT